MTTVMRDSIKKIDGKIFKYHCWCKTPERALESKTYLKNNGYFVRVIPTDTEGFYIYRRKK